MIERQRRTTVGFTAILLPHAFIATATLQDPAKHPDDHVRGNKTLWRIAIPLDTPGALGHWTIGHGHRRGER